MLYSVYCLACRCRLDKSCCLREKAVPLGGRPETQSQIGLDLIERSQTSQNYHSHCYYCIFASCCSGPETSFNQDCACACAEHRGTPRLMGPVMNHLAQLYLLFWWLNSNTLQRSTVSITRKKKNDHAWLRCGLGANRCIGALRTACGS